MSGRYAPISTSGGASSPTSPTASLRRSSISSIRRPSFSFRRQSSVLTLPDPEEMEAAFDAGSDDEEEGDGRRLLGPRPVSGIAQGPHFKLGDAEEDLNEKAEEMDPLSRPAADDDAPKDERDSAVPGSYDFDRDCFPSFVPPPPPSSPPPFQPNSSLFPAQGNTNGILPTLTSYPSQPSARIRKIQSAYRTLFGSLLPSYFGQPGSGQRSAGLVGGGGTTGVFANLAARPEAGRRVPGPGEVEGPEWVPEDAQKDGPPSYTTALRDAVPPYWETTVILPSSTSPFGPLTSSASGDEILIDGMSVGNLFTFGWNVLVSVSFQFIGFLLTYVLHTTHAAKHGSRAGLGITLIQYGLYLRSKAEEMIETGKFPTDSTEAQDAATFENEDPAKFWAPGWRTRPHPSPVDGEMIPEFDNYKEAEAWMAEHPNRTMSEILNLPTAAEVGEANEWLSFILMAVGWFLVLTSIGTYWRVKRFESSLRASQNATNDDPTAEIGNSTPSVPIPRSPFTSAFWSGHARNSAYQVRTWTSEASRQLGSRWQPFGPSRPTDLASTGANGDENQGRRGQAGGDTGAGHEMAYASWSGTAVPHSQFEEDDLLGREAYEYPGLQEGLHHGLPRDPFVISDRNDVD